jgi:cyclophilin family peptidyl-prolyl cis-trans isomerase
LFITNRTKRLVWPIVAILLTALLVTACDAASLLPQGGDETTVEEAVPMQTPQPEEEAAESEASAATGDVAQLPAAERVGFYSAPPEMTIEPDKYYYATLKTEQGDIRVQLFADRAPITVNNFVFLANEGYYDNTTFHRVLDGFMAQAGDPSGTGAGGPGYQFQDEFFPGLSFDRAGLLAMANAGPGTNGSQFFITFASAEHLNNRHTIFGEVIEGMEVLDQLTRRDPQAAPDFEGDLLETVEITVQETSELPTPTPLPPPTPTPTPYAPSSIAPEDLAGDERPLAELSLAERSSAFNTAPDMVIDAANTYTATVSTSKGEVVLALNDEVAPMAVNNFVLLASLGYYDGTPVNDVSDQLLIFGAPENNPASYVGYLFPAEMNTTVTWNSGAIGYLPAQDPLTGEIVSNGSQVLLTFEAPPAEASQQIAFFGEVVEGLEVLSSLTFEDTIDTISIEESGE